MNWLMTTLLAGVMFASSNAITKLFQVKLSNQVGMFIFSLGVALMSLMFLLFTKEHTKILSSNNNGLILAVVSGLVWAIAQYSLIITFSKNAPVSVVIPIVVAAIAVGGVLAGVIIFGENINLQKIIAMFVIIAGIVMLSR